MSGFPTRVSRSSFGPTLEDKWPVVNPKTDIGADSFNLLFHQTAGMNAVTSRGLLYVSVEGTTVTTVFQGVAWDPNSEMAKITWTRSEAGIYTWSLPQASYEDEEGNAITVSILGGMVLPQELYGGNVLVGQNVKTGARSGQVHITAPGLNSAHQDSDFLFIFW